MSPHSCVQTRRLLKIEDDVCAESARYRERDEVIRKALLELGGEIARLGGSVANELAALRKRVDRLAKAVSPARGRR